MSSDRGWGILRRGGDESFASIRTLLDGAFAFRWWYFALIPAAILAVMALESGTGFTFPELLATGVAGVMAPVGWAVALHGLMQQFRRRTGRRPFVLHVLFYAGLGVMLGIVRVGFVQDFTDADPDAFMRMLGSITGAMTWAPALAVLQGMLEARNRALRELRGTRRRLEEIRRDAESSIEEQLRRLSTTARQAVQPHIDTLAEAIEELKDGVSRGSLRVLQERIQHVSADVVRVTSHRFGGGDALDAVPRSRVLAEVLGDVLRRPIGAPWVLAAALVLGSGPEFVRMEGLAAFSGLIVLVVAVTVAMTAAERLTAGRNGAGGTIAQWSVLAVLIATQFAVATPLIGGSDPAGVGTVVLFLPLVSAGALMSSAAIASRRRTLEHLDDLERRNGELRQAVEAARSEADELRRRVAALLHGPVQGRLSAASMLLGLHLSGRSGRSVTDVIAELESLVAAAAADLEALAAPAPPEHRVVDTIERLRRDWDGIVRVDSVVTDDALAALASSAALAALADDIVIDMVSNAARHGRARRVDFDIRMQRSVRPLGGVLTMASAVVITADNTGSAPTAAPSGLVQRAVTAFGGTWTLAGPAGRVRSEARLPVPVVDVPGRGAPAPDEEAIVSA